jgi:pimeloyl-ACP methyl ester carboxylesterase
MSVFTHDGIDLFYTDTGAGPVALLLHGWTCDSHDWSWQIPTLLDLGFRVVAVDHRGHGRSSAPDTDYRPEALADDAAALLRHLEVAPAVVIGHSLGTIVTSALAVRHPELVQAIVLVDPVYQQNPADMVPALEAIRGPLPREATVMLFRSAFYTPETPAHLPVWHERRVLGTPEHVVRDVFLGLYGHDEGLGLLPVSREYLRRRAVPRLAVYASEEATFLERELPLGEQDEIHVIPAGHFLHQQRPEEFNALLTVWLNRLGLVSAPSPEPANAG